MFGGKIISNSSFLKLKEDIILFFQIVPWKPLPNILFLFPFLSLLLMNTFLSGEYSAGLTLDQSNEVMLYSCDHQPFFVLFFV